MDAAAGRGGASLEPVVPGEVGVQKAPNEGLACNPVVEVGDSEQHVLISRPEQNVLISLPEQNVLISWPRGKGTPTPHMGARVWVALG